MDSELMSDLLKTDYDSIRQDSELGFKQVEEFASFLNITIEQLINGNYDIDLIKESFIFPHSKVPSEYLNEAGTFIETISGVADYVEHLYNGKTRKHLLDELQLSEHSVRSPNLLLNASVLKKTGQVLKDLNVDSYAIREMAIHINNNSKRKKINELIKDCRTDQEIAQKICDATNDTYDKNFRYHLESHGDKFQVVGISKESIHDELKSKVICDEVFTLFKAYTVATTPAKLFGRSMHLLEVNDTTTGSHQVQRFTFQETKPLLQWLLLVPFWYLVCLPKAVCIYLPSVSNRRIALRP